MHKSCILYIVIKVICQLSKFLHRIKEKGKALSGIVFLFPSENEAGFLASCSSIITGLCSQITQVFGGPLSALQHLRIWKIIGLEGGTLCLQDLLYVFFRAVVEFLPFLKSVGVWPIASMELQLCPRIIISVRRVMQGHYLIFQVCSYFWPICSPLCSFVCIVIMMIHPRQ